MEYAFGACRLQRGKHRRYSVIAEADLPKVSARIEARAMLETAGYAYGVASFMIARKAMK